MNDDTETTGEAPEAPPEVTCTGGARLRLRASADPAPAQDEEAATDGN